MPNSSYPSHDGVELTWGGGIKAMFSRKLPSGLTLRAESTRMVAQFWIRLAGVPIGTPVPVGSVPMKLKAKSERKLLLAGVLDTVGSGLAIQTFADPSDMRLRLVEPCVWPGVQIDSVTRRAKPLPPASADHKAAHEEVQLEVEEIIGLSYLARRGGRVRTGYLWREIFLDEGDQRSDARVERWVDNLNAKLLRAGASEQVRRLGGEIRSEPLDGFVPSLRIGGTEVDEDTNAVRTGNDSGKLRFYTAALLRFLNDRRGKSIDLAQLKSEVGAELAESTFEHCISELRTDLKKWFRSLVVFTDGDNVRLEEIDLRVGDLRLIGNTLHLLDLESESLTSINEISLHNGSVSLMAAIADQTTPFFVKEVADRTGRTERAIYQAIDEVRGLLKGFGSATTIQNAPSERVRFVLNESFGGASLGISGNANQCFIDTPIGGMSWTLKDYRLVSKVARSPYGVDSDDLIDYIWGEDALGHSGRDQRLRNEVDRTNEKLIAAGSPVRVGSKNGYVTMVPSDHVNRRRDSAIRKRPVLPGIYESGAVAISASGVKVGAVEFTDAYDRKVIEQLVRSPHMFIPQIQLSADGGQLFSAKTARRLASAHAMLIARAGPSGREFGIVVVTKAPLLLPVAVTKPLDIDDRSLQFRRILQGITKEMVAVVRETSWQPTLQDAKRVEQAARFVDEWLSGVPPSADPTSRVNSLFLALAHRPLYLPPNRDERTARLAQYTFQVATGIKLATSLLDQERLVRPQSKTGPISVQDEIFKQTIAEAGETLLDVLAQVHEEYVFASAVEIGAWWSRGERVADRRMQLNMVREGGESANAFAGVGLRSMNRVLHDYDRSTALITSNRAELALSDWNGPSEHYLN